MWMTFVIEFHFSFSPTAMYSVAKQTDVNLLIILSPLGISLLHLGKTALTVASCMFVKRNIGCRYFKDGLHFKFPIKFNSQCLNLVCFKKHS